MATKQANELTVKEQTSIAVYDYGEYAGSGFENTSGKDLSIPLMQVLQTNSPQVTEENPKDSKPGLIFNSVTKELISGETGFNFLPVHYVNAFVEWVPREKGGGYVGQYDRDSEEVRRLKASAKDKKAKLITASGNEVIETSYVYGLLLDPEGKQTTGFAVIPFASTKLKPYKDWITSMYTLKGKPPLFANRATIKTTKQKNEKGTYYNLQINPLKETWIASLINPISEKALLQEAIEFREMVISGIAKVNYESQDTSDYSSEEGSVIEANTTSEKVPF